MKLSTSCHIFSRMLTVLSWATAGRHLLGGGGEVWGMSHYSQIQLIHRLKDGGGTRHDYRWA